MKNACRTVIPRKESLSLSLSLPLSLYIYIYDIDASILDPNPALDNTLKTLGNKRAAVFIFLYYIVTTVSRLSAYGSYTLLEMLWGCNVSMLQAALGVFTNQPVSCAWRWQRTHLYTLLFPCVLVRFRV